MPLVLAGLQLCAPSLAKDSARLQLKQVEKAIDDTRLHQDEATKLAAALAAELASLRDASVAAAQAAQAHEAALDTLAQQLADLEVQERAKAATLDRDRVRQTQLLMALARLAASPPESLALAPGTPIEALRGGLLMSRAVPPLLQEAATLKQEIAALETVRAEIDATHARQHDEGAALAVEQTRLTDLIARKAALQAEAQRTVESDRRRQVALAADAVNLRDLIDRLEAERKRVEAERLKAEAAREKEEAERAPPPEAEPPPQDAVAVTAPAPVQPDPRAPRHIRSFAHAHGAMEFPVSGTLVRRYGAPDEFGNASRGITFETRPGAVVTAPYDGQVLFAGPFRGYGRILIIGHGDGYHSLLAGLDRLDSSVGQWLVAGEPVGAMSGDVDKPRLYLELRHDNQPINPSPWLATRLEKVNG